MSQQQYVFQSNTRAMQHLSVGRWLRHAVVAAPALQLVEMQSARTRTGLSSIEYSGSARAADSNTKLPCSLEIEERAAGHR